MFILKLIKWPLKHFKMVNCNDFVTLKGIMYNRLLAKRILMQCNKLSVFNNWNPILLKTRCGPPQCNVENQVKLQILVSALYVGWRWGADSKVNLYSGLACAKAPKVHICPKTFVHDCKGVWVHNHVYTERKTPITGHVHWASLINEGFLYGIKNTIATMEHSG